MDPKSPVWLALAPRDKGGRAASRMWRWAIDGVMRLCAWARGTKVGPVPVGWTPAPSAVFVPIHPAPLGGGGGD